MWTGMVLAELESEKATFEVNAEKAGLLKTVGKEGDTLKIGDLVAQIDESAAKPEGTAAPEQKADSKPEPNLKRSQKRRLLPAETVSRQQICCRGRNKGYLWQLQSLQKGC